MAPTRRNNNPLSVSSNSGGNGDRERRLPPATSSAAFAGGRGCVGAANARSRRAPPSNSPKFYGGRRSNFPQPFFAAASSSSFSSASNVRSNMQMNIPFLQKKHNMNLERASSSFSHSTSSHVIHTILTKKDNQSKLLPFHTKESKIAQCYKETQDTEGSPHLLSDEAGILSQICSSFFLSDRKNGEIVARAGAVTPGESILSLLERKTNEKTSFSHSTIGDNLFSTSALFSAPSAAPIPLPLLLKNLKKSPEEIQTHLRDNLESNDILSQLFSNATSKLNNFNENSSMSNHANSMSNPPFSTCRSQDFLMPQKHHHSQSHSHSCFNSHQKSMHSLKPTNNNMFSLPAPSASSPPLSSFTYSPLSSSASPPPPSRSFVPNWVSSLEEELDKKLIVILRDGRKFVGFLRTFDQFGNLVLEDARERIIISHYFSNFYYGCMIIRGENVVLFGAIDENEDMDEEISEARIDEDEDQKNFETFGEKKKSKNESSTSDSNSSLSLLSNEITDTNSSNSSYSCVKLIRKPQHEILYLQDLQMQKEKGEKEREKNLFKRLRMESGGGGLVCAIHKNIMMDFNNYYDW